MKKVKLSFNSFENERLDRKEMVSANGLGVAGPPALYWSECVDDATLQEVGQITLELAWGFAKFFRDVARFCI